MARWGAAPARKLSQRIGTYLGRDDLLVGISKTLTYRPRPLVSPLCAPNVRFMIWIIYALFPPTVQEQSGKSIHELN